MSRIFMSKQMKLFDHDYFMKSQMRNGQMDFAMAIRIVNIGGSLVCRPAATATVPKHRHKTSRTILVNLDIPVLL